MFTGSSCPYYVTQCCHGAVVAPFTIEGTVWLIFINNRNLVPVWILNDHFQNLRMIQFCFLANLRAHLASDFLAWSPW